MASGVTAAGDGVGLWSQAVIPASKLSSRQPPAESESASPATVSLLGSALCSSGPRTGLLRYLCYCRLSGFKTDPDLHHGRATHSSYSRGHWDQMGDEPHPRPRPLIPGCVPKLPPGACDPRGCAAASAPLLIRITKVSHGPSGGPRLSTPTFPYWGVYSLCRWSRLGGTCWTYAIPGGSPSWSSWHPPDCTG